MAAALRFADILEVLSRHEVDLIVVGGVAAILEGAPVSTFDLDVVILRVKENHTRLLAALQELSARYLDPAGRHIVPDAEKMETIRIHRLMTDSGPLDVLESIGHGLTFADLIDQTVEYEIAGCRVRTLRLEMVIRSKEQAHRDKDQMALPVLYRTLQMKQQGPGTG